MLACPVTGFVLAAQLKANHGDQQSSLQHKANIADVNRSIMDITHVLEVAQTTHPEPLRASLWSHLHHNTQKRLAGMNSIVLTKDAVFLLVSALFLPGQGICGRFGGESGPVRGAGMAQGQGVYS